MSEKCRGQNNNNNNNSDNPLTSRHIDGGEDAIHKLKVRTYIFPAQTNQL